MATRTEQPRSPHAGRNGKPRAGGDGRRMPNPAPSGLAGVIAKRASDYSLEGPNHEFMHAQKHVWNFLMDHYFRMEFGGWHRLPDETSLLIGVHSGGSLTMDAWTVGLQWWRRFEDERILHGTAHDVLMATPGLGDYFRLMGALPANGKAIGAALDAGHDVVIWPGGDVDAMRSWTKRDKAVLGGRKGFVRMAIRKGVPIVPIATVGGHDTVFVLTEGRRLAKLLGIKKVLRGEVLPIVLGFPCGIAPEILPVHIPLPAKIRTEFMEPVDVGDDPAKVDDKAFVNGLYREVESRIQSGMNELARRRSFPIFG